MTNGEQADWEQALNLLQLNGLDVLWRNDDREGGRWELTVVGGTAQRLHAYMAHCKQEMDTLAANFDPASTPSNPEAQYCFALGQFSGAMRVLQDLYIHIGEVSK